MKAEEELVKENKPLQPVLSSVWLLAGLALSAGALLVALAVDVALPAPLSRDAARTSPERFVAELAQDHLVNLTAVGPRVAGSYENEVVTVAVLVAAIRRIAAQASPHNVVELDVQRASGNFALTFMDGMNNVYRDVQNVVARVRGAGGAAGARPALLLNCHFDSVPDSPGASDDAAGCAVMLETLRALAATRQPLRHDAIFLFNGAEENILQASHAFITQHKWARAARAFINIEACGAGGREVMFQAGPRDPWIIEVYAGAVPHPFASSLAQEMFQSGAIPADTDFRIFRDFGKLSGVDLAWSANGYVYHTRLDTAARVPPAALQRTGDNVLALARGLLASEHLARDAAPAAAPAFFDVLGRVLLVAGPRAAAALAGATLALVALKVHLNARAAQRRLCVAYGAWWRAALAGAAAALLAGAGGAAAAAGAGALLHAAGARLAWFSRPWLLAPLFALPGAAASWALLAALWRAWLARAAGGALLRRGWWGARALHDAGALLAGAALLACACAGLRSGFVPLLWALAPAAADAAGSALRVRDGRRAALWALGAALPLLQTAYLLLNTLRMFVPIMGRAGAQAAPPDVVMALLTAALALATLGWLLPFVVVTHGVGRLARALGALGGAALVLAALGLWAPYGDVTPQRLMLFHTRRTLHAGTGPPAAAPDHFYWVPELDANTRRALQEHVGAPAELGAAECARALYCGAPYYLPVLALVGRSYVVEAPAAPLAELQAELRVTAADGARTLWLNVTRAPAHVVLIVSPAEGAALTWARAGAGAGAAPLAGALWGARRTYFYSLHAARAPATWALELRFLGGGARLADVSLAGHAMFGPARLQPAHAALLRRAPPHVAATGWGVDLHLYEL